MENNTIESEKERSTKVQDRLEWRRNKVLEMASKGFNNVNISKTLLVSESTISRDIDYLSKTAKENIKKHIEERIPLEYKKVLFGVEEIIKSSWQISEQTDDTREKLAALTLAKEAYNSKLELLLKSEILDSAINFVGSHRGEILQGNNNSKQGDNNDLEGPSEVNTVF